MSNLKSKPVAIMTILILAVSIGASTMLIPEANAHTPPWILLANNFEVMQAPAAIAAPTTAPASAADMYFVPTIAGLFVLIIVVAIVLALLMLRKRP